MATTLFIPSDWLANTFFKDGKITPTFFAENTFQKQMKWFPYSRVVIPGNVGGHWVAIIIDFKLKLITFCNSFQDKLARPGNKLFICSKLVSAWEANAKVSFQNVLSERAGRFSIPDRWKQLWTVCLSYGPIGFVLQSS